MQFITPARRARLAWFHTQAGIFLGWLTFIIFLAGTLSLADVELTRWMQPETAVIPDGAVLSDAALDRAVQILREDEKAGRPRSFIRLPEPRDPALHILHFNGHAFTGSVIDPRDGRTVPARDTEGGVFFFNFHYTLRLPYTIGEPLVSFITLATGLMILSGVLLQIGRMIPDYFTLRLKASRPRFLLDLHLLSGTVMLPFHIIITWTGLVLMTGNAFPFIPVRLPHRPPQVSGSFVPAASLGPVLREFRQRSGNAPGYIIFSPGKITVYGLGSGEISAVREPLDFDGRTGRLLPGDTKPAGLTDGITRLAWGLHLARNMGTVLLCLWFTGGVLSTVMIASGLIYYTTLRRRRNVSSAPGVAERLCPGAVGGAVVAFFVYLLLNHTLPADMPGRRGFETNGFFLAWVMCCLAGFLPFARVVAGRFVWSRLVWQAVLALAGITGLCVVVSDAVIVLGGLWLHGVRLVINGLCFVTALSCLAGVYGLRRHRVS
ncbi:PepSY domain-containing protein [Acetobacter sp. AN02]|uniref:PepSY-associated TM helix domain-containing protein n=1 Tax=Acetobacter sp. AN02 TaxID=2894186 RepID=UPI0024342CF7|nr:PepSY-associated TM helix domain-containing protein [Acetobacter sp. AN02]MDG6094622.1 PepSY domain-containing protein [Acetobacter sp. AN02]